MFIDDRYDYAAIVSADCSIPCVTCGALVDSSKTEEHHKFHCTVEHLEAVVKRITEGNV